MKELAESKPLYKVTLKNGREIITSINSDLIEKAVMTAKMIKLTWILVNTDMISTVEPYNGDDIDHYLVWLNDDVMIDRLKRILLERKNKNLWMYCLSYECITWIIIIRSIITSIYLTWWRCNFSSKWKSIIISPLIIFTAISLA